MRLGTVTNAGNYVEAKQSAGASVSSARPRPMVGRKFKLLGHPAQGYVG